MKKGKGLTINIHLTNRWLYTFIAIGILAAIGVGVYALTPGIIPNPGHDIQTISPPTGCAANQYLQFNGTNWKCNTPLVGYSNLNDLKGAVSNNFHNLGGHDEGFGGMYIKKTSDGSCYVANPYTKACSCNTFIHTAQGVATLSISGGTYELYYCLLSGTVQVSY